MKRRQTLAGKANSVRWGCTRYRTHPAGKGHCGACRPGTEQQADRKLVVSQRTAESHVLNILNKLGFNSRTQITSWATTNEPLNSITSRTELGPPPKFSSALSISPGFDLEPCTYCRRNGSNAIPAERNLQTCTWTPVASKRRNGLSMEAVHLGRKVAQASTSLCPRHAGPSLYRSPETSGSATVAESVMCRLADFSWLAKLTA